MDSTHRIQRKPAPSSPGMSTDVFVSETPTWDGMQANIPNGKKTQIPSSSTHDGTSRRFGSKRTFPILGIGALILALLCMIACIVVLILSNGKPATSWMVQPTVLLAIFSAVSNSVLAFALTEGVTLSWWNKALRGSTVRDLHYHWLTGTSVWAAFTKLRYLNTVAFAAIVVVLVVADGPLLQRASSVVSQPVNGPVPIQAAIAPELPVGYTAFISGRNEDPDRMNAPFIQVMQDYINRAPIISGLSGCVGTCTVDVPAAGLAAVCTSTETFINYEENLPSPTGPLSSQNDSAAYNYQPAFSVDFRSVQGEGPEFGVHSGIIMEVSYAQTNSCSGVIVTNTCNLTEAVLLYHAEITSGIITLVPPFTNLTVLASTNNTLAAETTGSNSTLGGVYIAATDLFGCNATLRFGGAIGFQPFGLTTFPSAYIEGGGEIMGCQYDWKDPTDDILAALGNIMFRTAIQVMNDTGTNLSSIEDNFPLKQTLQGVDVGAQNVFKTHYTFMAVAAAVMMLGIMSVVPTFYRFWLLGRQVSFSPIEIAKAFDSPLLRDTAMAASGEADLLVDRVGGRKVRYGFVNEGQNRYATGRDHGGLSMFLERE